MAIVTCKECGNAISDEAATCIYCGAPLKTSVAANNWMVKKNKTSYWNRHPVQAFLVAFFVVAAVFTVIGFDLGSDNKLPDQQTAAKVETMSNQTQQTQLSAAKIQSAKDSIVLIICYDDKDEVLGSGSGFCAYQNNCIVTDYHVVEGAAKVVIYTDNGTKYEINQILVFNQEDDLALLQGEFELPMLTISEKEPMLGDQALLIGSPNGDLNVVTAGQICSLYTDGYVLTDAATYGGSSGGALLNSNLEVTGIIQQSLLNGDSFGYAATTDKLNALYEAYIQKSFYQLSGPDMIAIVPKYEEITDLLGNFPTGDLRTEFSHIKGDYHYYNAPDMLLFYQLTNPEELLKQMILMKSELKDVYLNMSERQQDNVYQTFLAYFQYEYTKGDDIDNISDWGRSEFFLYLNLFGYEDTAIITADLNNCRRYDQMLAKVDEYPVELAEKYLILYLFQYYSNLSDMPEEGKDLIIDYFNAGDYTTSELCSIFTELGYTINKKEDGYYVNYD